MLCDPKMREQSTKERFCISSCQRYHEGVILHCLHYLTDDANISLQPNINYMRRQLLIQLHKGKAFTSHLLDEAVLPGHSSPTYTLHLSFRGQRFRSKPAVCTDEPDIRESFLLELHVNEQKGTEFKSCMSVRLFNVQSAHSMLNCGRISATIIQFGYDIISRLLFEYSR